MASNASLCIWSSRLVNSPSVKINAYPVWVGIFLWPKTFEFPHCAVLPHMTVPKNILIEIVASRKSAWTVAALSTLLEMSPKTLYAQVKRGVLPAYRIGTSIRFDPCRVAAWLAASEL